MKTKLFYLCLGVITLSMVSCETENNSETNVNNVAAKQTVVVTTTNVNLPDFSPCVTTDLLAGRRFDAGELRVYFDAEKVYVEYETNENWYIRKTHLYIGDQELTPVNRRGEPVPVNFPMGGTHPEGEQNIVYSISKDVLPKCFSISANAEVYLVQDGEIVLVETAWARGERFTQSSWGMFFDVCQSNCW
ncbi:hypothetical protein [Flavobacterium sp.]|uniref:hypothetical protein n=1 Tax=Flavobacterium sp. TaxID=239 RepID=UPI0039198967